MPPNVSRNGKPSHTGGLSLNQNLSTWTPIGLSIITALLVAGATFGGLQVQLAQVKQTAEAAMPRTEADANNQAIISRLDQIQLDVREIRARVR